MVFARAQMDPGRSDPNGSDCKGVNMSRATLVLVGLLTAVLLAWNGGTAGAQAGVLLTVMPATTDTAVGQAFSVTVEVQAGAQQVDGASAFLSFDPGVLQVVNVTGGSVLPVPILNQFSNAAGTVDYSAGTFSAFPTGTFALATITFSAVASATASSLSFGTVMPRQSEVTFGGTSVLDGAQGGTVNVAAGTTATPTPTAVPTPTPTGLQIAGRIRYYLGTDRPVPGVDVDLTGGLANVVQTGATGQYGFAGLWTGDWAIEPGKQGDFAGAISAFDAALVLQHLVGLRTLSATQQLACDVTGNGGLSALDASRILQFVVGMLPRMPVATQCGSDWVFVPTPAAVPGQIVTPPQISTGTCQGGRVAYQPLTANAAGQDILGLLFGDCSGNWNPPAAAAMAASGADAGGEGWRVGRPRHGRFGKLAVPLWIDAAQPFNALAIDLRYDPTQLRALRVYPGSSVRGALMHANETAPGVLKVAVASATAVYGGERPHFVVRFVAAERDLPPNPLRVERLVIDDRRVERVAVYGHGGP